MLSEFKKLILHVVKEAEEAISKPGITEREMNCALERRTVMIRHYSDLFKNRLQKKGLSEKEALDAVQEALRDVIPCSGGNLTVVN